MTVITQVVTAPPNPARKNKAAVFGDSWISKPMAKMLAKALVKNIPETTKVFTLKSDRLGRYVRKECKRQGRKTIQHTLRSHEVGSSPEELAVARLAWKVEAFYCARNVSKNKSSIANYAIEIGYSMRYFIKVHDLDYSKL